MFKEALKGTKVSKARKYRSRGGDNMRAFSAKDAKRWRKEGRPENMMKMGKIKF